MLLALFQPDIPQNLGAAIRLGACLDTQVHVIEPCGFPLSDKAILRAALDYGDPGQVVRHPSWDAFRADDILLFGQESAGVPDFVHDAADARVIIPLSRGRRSFNLTVSAAIGLSEALRQTGQFPPFHPQDFPSHD